MSGCPICSSTETDELADRAAMQQEVERVWTFHERRLRQPVPLPQLTDRVVFSQSPPLRLVDCRGCGHLYRNPHERAEALRETYAYAKIDESIYESLFAVQRAAYRVHAGRLARFCGPIKSGLEVGSYTGAFLAAARDLGMNFTGIDVNPATASFAGRRGLRVETTSIEELAGQGCYDAIVIWNTFEQLPDVNGAALAARRLLRHGGTLAVRVPNGGFYRKWRGRLATPLGAIAERILIHNNLLGFPYRQGFGLESMRRLLAKAGFRIKVVQGDTLVPIADQWTTRLGTLEERLTKVVERAVHRGWSAPWVEVYAAAE